MRQSDDPVHAHLPLTRPEMVWKGGLRYRNPKGTWPIIIALVDPNDPTVCMGYAEIHKPPGRMLPGSPVGKDTWSLAVPDDFAVVRLLDEAMDITDDRGPTFREDDLLDYVSALYDMQIRRALHYTKQTTAFVARWQRLRVFADARVREAVHHWIVGSIFAWPKAVQEHWLAVDTDLQSYYAQALFTDTPVQPGHAPIHHTTGLVDALRAIQHVGKTRETRLTWLRGLVLKGNGIAECTEAVYEQAVRIHRYARMPRGPLIRESSVALPVVFAQWRNDPPPMIRVPSHGKGRDLALRDLQDKASTRADGRMWHAKLHEILADEEQRQQNMAVVHDVAIIPHSIHTVADMEDMFSKGSFPPCIQRVVHTARATGKDHDFNNKIRLHISPYLKQIMAKNKDGAPAVSPSDTLSFFLGRPVDINNPRDSKRLGHLGAHMRCKAKEYMPTVCTFTCRIRPSADRTEILRCPFPPKTDH